MNINFNEIKNIVDTLPLGLYCGRRVPLVCVENNSVGTSFYCPSTDTIEICANLIMQGLENAIVDNSYSKETAIRSMVYHELSHAILTPSSKNAIRLFKSAFGNSTRRFSLDHAFSILNLVEDERIETVLQNYYLDTNFKKQVLMICGGSVPTPTNADQAFFNLVRFNVYEPQFQPYADRLTEILNNAYCIKANSLIGDNYYKYYDIVYDYYRNVIQLYEDFIKAYSSAPSHQDTTNQQEQTTQNINSSANSDSNDFNSDMQNESTPTKDTNNDTNGNANDNAEGNDDTENQSASQSLDNSDTNNDTSKMLSKGCSLTKEDIKQIFNEVLDEYIDTALTSQIEIILNNFKKKTNAGSGVTSFSGVFNPRNVKPNNYKYFDRSLSTNGNNKYGKFHLNLYVDDSGSFSNNAKNVNTLLHSLQVIAKKNPNFTFDLIKCGDHMVEPKETDMFIKADGGTGAIYDETFAIFKKHNLKKDCVVHNILLYDGRCDMYGRNIFPIFDKSNCTLLLEDENLRGYAKVFDNMKSAKIINMNMNGKSYADNLISEVLKALNVAFR